MPAPKPTLLRYDDPVLAGAGTKRRADVDHTTKDVLNSLLPPREYQEDGQDLIQYVSTAASSRADVLKLQAELDQRLAARKAKLTGICPVRSQLYGQCFDEIIRQVTIDCPARGLLLCRVRDELRTTVSAYQTLYESACTWGLRKASQVEAGKDEVEREHAKLVEEKMELEIRAAELQGQIEALEKREEDYRIQKEKEHADETTFLKRQTAQLKAQLEQMLGTK